MDYKIEIEELIKKLLNEGFNPEEIVLNFKISMEEIEKCQKQLKEEKNTYKDEGIIEKKQIRTERKDYIVNIDDKNKDPYKLLNYIIFMENELKNKPFETINEKKKFIEKKKMIENICAEAIINVVNSTNNLEELQKLSTKIPFKMATKCPLTIGRAKTALGNKITQLQQNKYLSNYTKTISNEIMQIALTISNKDFDYQNAIKIIEQEANNRVQGRQKTKFSLTKEQEVTQILNQIRTIILEKQAEQYPIKNPQVAIGNLLKLTNNDLNMSLGTVIHNLIARKKFETAEEICDEYLKKYNYSETEHNLYLICKNLKNEVIHTKEEKKENIENENVQGI